MTSDMRSRSLLPRVILGITAALLAWAVLSGVSLADGFEGFGDGEGFEGGDGEEGGFGALAAMALTVNIAYIPYKWVRQIIPELNIPSALSIHCWAGAAAFLFGTLHAFTAGDGNLILWFGLLLMGYQTAAGLVMRSELATGRLRRYAYLLHAQRAAFYLMLASLFLGHALAGD